VVGGIAFLGGARLALPGGMGHDGGVPLDFKPRMGQQGDSVGSGVALPMSGDRTLCFGTYRPKLSKCEHDPQLPWNASVRAATPHY